MIQLFVSDIDGCLSEPFQPYDLTRFDELRAYVRAAGAVNVASPSPVFSICSGRSYPYVEAVTQALDVRAPVLFEAGSGLYDPESRRVHWHPSLTDEMEREMEEARRWLILECLPGTSFRYDYGKRTQAGVMGANPDEIAAYAPIVEAHVRQHFPDLCVFHTSVSIDILSSAITKREGMRWLSDVAGFPLEHMAFIGDTHGDLGALEAVGFAFAPANADGSVRERVPVVTRGRHVDGVLEAYRWCRTFNESELKRAASG